MKAGTTSVAPKVLHARQTEQPARVYCPLVVKAVV